MPTISYARLDAIPPDECMRLLETESLGRLAVVVDEQPLVFPVNYVMHDGRIAFRTDVGTKLSAANDRPVAFEIDGVDVPYHEGWSVVVTGIAHEEREPSVIRELDLLPLRPWAPGGKDRWMRIGAAAVTGRRLVHVPHPEPHSEPHPESPA